MQASDIIETQLVQRAFDGAWERVVKVMDHENAYPHTNEQGMKITLIPTKWVTVAVYPFIMEEVTNGN